METKNNPVLCPCGTGKNYAECCHPFHQGGIPKAAVELMRSRYAAYALCLPDYINHTTHPASPHFCHDVVDWTEQIREFCLNTKFQGLEILDFKENGQFATVTFFAHLIQGEKDVSFTEKSYFEKIKGKWLYRSGQLTEGRAPNPAAG